MVKSKAGPVPIKDTDDIELAIQNILRVKFVMFRTERACVLSSNYMSGQNIGDFVW